MAIQVGKREKIFSGVVGLVFAIAALHMLIFKPQHDAYANAKRQYDEMASQASAGATPPNAQQVLETYRAETERLRQQYQSYYESLDLKNQDQKWVDIYWSYAGAGEKSPYPMESEAAARLTAAAQALLDFKDKENRNDMSFLTGDTANSWRLPQEIPQAYQRNQSNMRDDLKFLNSNAQFMYIYPAKAMEYYSEWARYLYNITGTTQEQWEQIYLNCGPQAAAIKLLLHIELIIRETSRDGATPPFTRDELRRMFQIRLNPTGATGLIPLEAMDLEHQLQSVLKLMEFARSSGVDDVYRVRLDSARDVLYDEKWFAPPEEVVAEVAETPAAQAYAYGYGRAYGYSYGYGYGYGAAAAAVATPETQTAVGKAPPIWIEVVGSNQSVSSFLYNAARSERNFEFDGLSLTSSLFWVGKEGKIYAQASLYALSQSELIQAP